MTQPAYFRKGTVIIEAMQFVKTPNGRAATNHADIVSWVGESARPRPPHVIGIKTLEGTHVAQVGDWIIKGVQGEFYLRKQDIFEVTYEPIEP